MVLVRELPPEATPQVGLKVGVTKGEYVSYKVLEALSS
jgi:hypothetical protein